MGEPNLNNFDGLSTEPAFEQRHTRSSDLRPRGGDPDFFQNGQRHGGGENWSSTLASEHISQPIKVGFEQPKQATEVPEPTPVVAETTAGSIEDISEPAIAPENTSIPSEGVMSFMAPGIGELPKAETDPVSTPSVPEPATELATPMQSPPAEPLVDQETAEAKAWADRRIEQIKAEFNPTTRQYGQDVVAKIKDDFQAGVRGQEAIGLKMPQPKEPEITPLPTWEEGPQKPLAADRGREALGLELPKDEIELPKNMETWEEVGKRFEEVEARLEETLAGLKEYLSKIEEEEAAKEAVLVSPEYAGPVAAQTEIEPDVEKGKDITIQEPTSEAGALEKKESPAPLESFEGYERVAQARRCYLESRAKRRNWFRRGDQEILKKTEARYQEKLTEFLFSAAESKLAPNLLGEERERALIENATLLEVQEMLTRSEEEVALVQEKIGHKTLQYLKAHPYARATIGALLLAAGAGSALLGNVPLSVGILAARSAVSGVGTAVGVEGMIDGIASRLEAKNGLLADLDNKEISELGDRDLSRKIAGILARSVRRGESVGKTPEKELLLKLTKERTHRLKVALAVELRSGKSSAEARKDILLSSLRQSMHSERLGQEKERRDSIKRWVMAGVAGLAAGAATWVAGAGNLNKAETATRAAKDLTRHTTQNVAGASGGAETAGKTAAKEIYRQVADSNDGPEHMFRRALKNYALKHNIKLSDSQLVRAGDWMAQKHLKPLGLNWKGHSLWVATGAKAEITDHTFHLISPDGAGKIFDHTVKFGLADAIKAVQ
jgi:hypothetical protein